MTTVCPIMDFEWLIMLIMLLIPLIPRCLARSDVWLLPHGC